MGEMFSVFCMGPAVSGCGLCDIDRVLFKILNNVSKIGKSWYDENIQIIIKGTGSNLLF